MSIGNKDREKKTFIQKFFTKERDGDNKMMKRSMTSDSFEAGEVESALVYPSSTTEGSSMVPGQQTQSHRVFVATWNAGGMSPHNGLNLDDFLQIQNPSDIYVLGFQEIVPLNAGNVLVIEDNEPAAKWLSMVNQSLNKNKAPRRTNSVGFFTKPSLRKVSKSFRTEKKKRLKSCNCGAAGELERKQSREFCWSVQQNGADSEASSEEEDEVSSSGYYANNAAHMKYGLVASKQMVGIFVTIWMRTHLVQHVSHLRISCISRGIMGCLGNKGCISVSFQLQQTSFCFVCSHLASGEKEGDELRRNLDVIEILKNTQFPKICKNPYSKIPEKILDHDRIIWFGDLNYRISLSYSDTRKLLEAKDWDALFNNDQLKIEREAGRVFKGWKEGKIYFAPTYKYSYNSDIYAGELHKSKSKRRTPAWCDRILWHGNGIQQLLYWRGESRFSDHRPVLATFLVDVVTKRNGLNKVSSRANMKIEIEELLPNKLCF